MNATMNAGMMDNRGTSFNIKTESNNPKNGCVLSRKMELAIVVIWIDAIQVIKCAAKKNPARIYWKLKLLVFFEPGFLL